MPVRILMLVSALSTGTQTYSENIIENFCLLGSEVRVAFIGSRPSELGCEIVQIDAGVPGSLRRSQLAPLFRLIMAIKNLRSAVSAFRPDVIFCQGLDELGLLGVVASRVFARPMMSFVHDLTLREFMLSRPSSSTRSALVALALLRQRFVASRTNLVVGSRFMRDSLREMFGVKAECIPLGVSSCFTPPPARTERPFAAVILGTLTVKKMPWIAIEALAQLKGTDITMRFVGSGPLRQSLEGMCNKLGVRDQVEFMGTLPKPALVQVLRGSTVMLVPSSWEGFGLAALEGMATGLPVVASKSGGLTELVVDGYNGYLFPVGESSELSGILRKLYADYREVERISQNSLTFAKKYSWMRTAAETLKLAEKLLRTN